MRQLEKLETLLDEKFNKKAPFKLSEGNRKGLAQNLWVFALVSGILQLYVGWKLWQAWHRVDIFVDHLNSYAANVGLDTTTESIGFSLYLAFTTLLVSGILLLLAAPGLKAMKKTGWSFIFYSLLINLAYGVIVLFTDYGGFGNLLAAAVGSLVGGYFLFQVREYFMKSAPHKVHKS